MSSKIIELTPDELQSVERVLTRLASAAPEASGECTRDDLLRAAQLMLAVRRARARVLHRSMLGEAAYDMLLALYATPDEQEITAARLAELSGIPQSSGLRWLEYLVSNGFVSRSPHPNDKRASVIALTERGRDALDEVAREMCERLRGLQLCR